MANLRGASVPPREAAAALAPYAMWVGRLPSTEDATWAERKALAFRRGYLGAWLEAEYQVRAARSSPARHAELCVQLARAARANEDWERAAKWFAAARESMNRVPSTERSFDLVADYYDEAVALREVTDVRVAYAAMAPFLGDESARGESLKIFARLVDFALVAHDEENYTKLATSLLTTARAWNREAPGAGDGPSEADRVLSAFIASLITRGYAGTAAQLVEAGIADAALRRALDLAAQVAAVAKENDAAILRFLADQSTSREADAALFGPDEQLSGLVTWLARSDRAAFASQLLATARDRNFAVNDGAARSQHERAWNAAVQRTAIACWQAGRAEDAGRLGRLFTEGRDDARADPLAREGTRIDVREGLVGFATWLGEHGQTAPAQRLLESLPVEYPQADESSEDLEQYRAMRADAGAAVLQQKRVALALAWAAAGDTRRAAEWLRQLPAEDRVGSAHWRLVRQQVLAAIAVAAAVAGDTELVTRSVDEARDLRSVGNQPTFAEALALVPALILTGRHEEAWEELANLEVGGPEKVIARAIPAVIARERANRVIEWIGFAPEAQRRAAWHAFFRAAVPEPDVLPVRG
jgi:hypothetical protein